MTLRRLAAFCDGDQGGNPAGVFIGEQLPDAAQMQRIAAEVGDSETAFAAPQGNGWRVRYFSPAAEVPFCGHATVALGAALAEHCGDGVFPLVLNGAEISVEGRRQGQRWSAALQSPPTQQRPVAPELLTAGLELFGYGPQDLDPSLPPAIVHGGADHLLLALRRREDLAAMRYAMQDGARLMQAAGLLTLLVVWAEGPQSFHSRNAFAIGGVYEDPATGSATAALAGYLQSLGWLHGGRIAVVQGEDMGCRSRLLAEIPAQPGGSIRVAGQVRPLEA
ncbi:MULTISPECIES: PhzF family phenazine biosynthesis protein [unclassified Cyanobium]|uniref:PhzF family phenazine biosynthesis protein n=1 Tax=unclassified Cyanobium TaxID=2627006 RepID=UPI0020CF84F6|nr:MULTISPECIES: PhzF family phenazine biosynthesis protein [unclassified Cyanobium]MCP9835297.1 PhzF family phenazine biosynthesis protein [Cyanobium sp. La Preciosa 7G6]MCP9938063.1 PhzF family phenazine biosynthesis protein [Cyanobium sp. Aljojuca 7A6]